MVLIYLKTGECIEIEDAFSVERRSETIACLDRRGYVTATFKASEIESFTANEEMASAMKEQVCEDLTVISNGEVVEEAGPTG